MKKRKTLPAHDKLNSILFILVQPDMWEEVLQYNVKLGTVYATAEKIENAALLLRENWAFRKRS